MDQTCVGLPLYTSRSSHCVTKNACSVKVGVYYIATMVLFDKGHYRNDSTQ